MEQTDFDGTVFADTLQDFNTLRYAGQVIHILCLDGNMGFTFHCARHCRFNFLLKFNSLQNISA